MYGYVSPLAQSSHFTQFRILHMVTWPIEVVYTLSTFNNTVQFASRSTTPLTSSPVASGGDFEEDELIFSIPRTAILSLNNVLSESDSHGISKVVSPDLLRQMPNWLVSSFLCMDDAIAARLY
jgi:hypothetical protein